MRRIAWGVWIVPCWVALAGCAGGYSSQDKLVEAINQYNEGMKWGRIQDALAYVPTEDQETFLERHKDWGRSVTLSGYEVVRTAYDHESETAIVQTQISWYRQTEQVLKTTLFEYRWEKNDDGDWKVVGERVIEGPLP